MITGRSSRVEVVDTDIDTPEKAATILSDRLRDLYTRIELLESAPKVELLQPFVFKPSVGRPIDPPWNSQGIFFATKRTPKGVFVARVNIEPQPNDDTSGLRALTPYWTAESNANQTGFRLRFISGLYGLTGVTVTVVLAVVY